ncbi:hypothetical protein FQR65_LT17067 [Abscondita terminalis]|nr:hypothetical protein FQR65_LT17067 [Abscondita terminalis]
MAKFNKWFLLPLCIGVVVFVVGILMLTVIFPNIIEKEVIENVELKEDTLQWYRFKEIPFPFNFNVYLFAIENKEEVLLGKTPKVREVGPFVYVENRDKIIHGIQKDEVAYSDLFTYTFDAKASGKNNENQTITFLNAPLMAVVQTLEMATLNLGVTMEDILDYIFEDTSLFIDVKVRDLTFGGIKMCDPTRNESAVSKLLRHQQRLCDELFRNQSHRPIHQLNTGLNNIDKLGFINSYKGEEYTQFWEGENNKCDKVNGFYTTYPPFMVEASDYTVYSSDICKHFLTATPSSEVTALLKSPEDYYDYLEKVKTWDGEMFVMENHIPSYL